MDIFIDCRDKKIQYFIFLVKDFNIKKVNIITLN